jgi:UDP-glucose 4-epimerase
LPGVLAKASIVDCNSLKVIPLIEFSARFIRKQIASFGKDVPPALRTALRAAIHASKLVSAEIKALVSEA